MTTSGAADASARWAWVAVAAAVIALSALLPPATVEILRYARAPLAAGQWWRLVTAHFVHLTAAHALLNAAALLLIAWLAPGTRRPTTGLWLLITSATAIDAGLYWLVPGVEWYAGASGALHGLFAGAGVLMLARGDRLQGAIMVAALAVKLAWEWVGGGSLVGATFPVVTESHLLGALGGLVGALLLLWPGRS